VAAIGGTSDRDLWVLGSSSSAHYNGSSWAVHPLAIPADAEGDGYGSDGGSDQVFAAGPDDAYARVVAVATSGSFFGQVETVLEHFNGTAWSEAAGVPNISTPGALFNSTVDEVTGSGPDDVYAAAIYDDNAKSELVHFNGKSWSIESLPESPIDVTVNVTGPGQALAMSGTSTSPSYAAQLSKGKWTTVSLPVSNTIALTRAGGGGTAWVQLLPYTGGNLPQTFWQRSGGRWTQIKPDKLLSSGIVAADSDGSGVWSTSGSGGAAETELYVK
jgi:hypothetical protein